MTNIYKPYNFQRFLFALGVFILCGLTAMSGWAQTPTPGLIFKPATTGTPGAGVLDPNSDGYVSATAAGFTGGNDLGAASELPYRYLPQRATSEPMSDVRVGPNTKFTDIADVPGGGSAVGFYVDGNSNYMFRFRLGGAAPNSKGYSIAIDTDNKFGFSGPNADPDAVAGNPGFEMEILLASNFGVRLYNINGTISPTDKGLDGVAGPDGSMIELPYASYAHKAIAATTNDGTLDVFYDFYIPLSVIQAQFGNRTFFSSTGASGPFSLTTPLRMVANTIIAPHSVTHYQNISDIGGLNDTAVPNPDNGFIDLIGAFTPTTGGALPPGGTIAARTAPPVVNSPLQKGVTTVSGTSTEAAGTVITVYVNGTALGTTATVLANGTWTLTGISALPAGALVKATALAPSKSVSDFSNEVLVSSTGINACATVPPTTTLCINPDGRGISGTLGTAYSGYKVYLRFLDGTPVPDNGGVTNGNFNTIVSNPVTADANGYFLITGKGGNSCNNGQQNALGGTYLISYQPPTTGGNPTPCETAGQQICVNSNTAATATPTISTANPITSSTTSISGTAAVGATVFLYVDGSAASSVTSNATTGAFTFSTATSTLPALTAGRVLTFNSATNLSCASGTVTRTVVTNRTVVPPVVSSPLYTGGIAVSGTSVEAAGSTITVTTYASLDGTGAATGTSTTTVQADGTWTVTVNALAANSSVKATVTPVDFGTSGFSNVVPVRTRTSIVPSITGTYTEGDATVTGTVPAGTAVGTLITVYEDGYPLSTVDGNGNVVPLTTTVQTGGTWTLSLAAINTVSPALYAGGVLTATATLVGQAESGLSNQVTVGCPVLVGKAIAAKAICQNTATTFTVTSAQAGIVYTLQNATDNTNVGASKVGTGTDLVLTTPVYATAGAYPLQLNTFYIGARICQDNSTSVNLTVNPLPLARPTAAQNATITTYPAARTGTNIQVQNSETTVSYQLVNTSVTPNANVGAPQTGTGGTLNLPTGPLDVSTATNRTTTTYIVLGTSTTAPTNCAQQVGAASVTYTGPLPVELTVFDATASNGDALLTWRTASEKNNDRFDVQRSVDGREFTMVGKVAGHGNSTQAQSYTYRDGAAGRLGEVLYYRLQQVDFDGTVSTSPMRAVRFGQAQAKPTLYLYPNPTTQAVTCRLEGFPSGDYTVTLLSLTGQVLRRAAAVSGQTLPLSVADLPAGVYVVHVNGAAASLTQRLVKLQ
jgi:hypothetical protein